MTAFINNRIATDGLSTIGRIAMPNGSLFWILEPGYETPAHPCIPAGDYALELRTDGGKYQQFRAVPELHDLIAPGLPHILVPDRQFVLVHPGNTVFDTEACSLPGMTRLPPSIAATHHWEVERSRVAFAQIYPFLRDACLAGGARWQVIDAEAD